MTKNYGKQRSYGNGNKNHYHKGGKPEFDLNSYSENIKNWIANGIEKETINFADKFGGIVARKGLTTSQIRTVFGEMRRIQMNGYVNHKTDFLLLKAKLAYAVKRHNNKKGLKQFFEFFRKAYDEVDTKDDEKGKANFKNMMNLLEAVLAYHKYHGGKE